jgi:hypothetical protein
VGFLAPAGRKKRGEPKPNSKSRAERKTGNGERRSANERGEGHQIKTKTRILDKQRHAIEKRGPRTLARFGIGFFRLSIKTPVSPGTPQDTGDGLLCSVLPFPSLCNSSPKQLQLYPHSTALQNT